MAEPLWQLAEGYGIDLLDHRRQADVDAVVGLWERAGVLDPDERRRRVHEVLHVAVGPEGDIAGVSTVYLDRVEQLGVDLWHFRTFVAPAHRRSVVATELARRARDHLAARFAAGEDHRGAGVVQVVQNQGLRQAYPQAVWFMVGFTYIGVDAAGDHVRVHWFDGALAPDPPR